MIVCRMLSRELSPIGTCTLPLAWVSCGLLPGRANVAPAPKPVTVWEDSDGVREEGRSCSGVAGTRSSSSGVRSWGFTRSAILKPVRVLASEYWTWSWCGCGCTCDCGVKAFQAAEYFWILRICRESPGQRQDKLTFQGQIRGNNKKV